MFYKKYGKRCFDIIGSLILLIIFSPIIVLVIILHKLFSQGSLIYRQARYGLNQQPFIIYKFRTMIPGAHKLLAKLMDKNCLEHPDFKIKNDPRITPLGRCLRKLCIDEVPQLINILKGDMSLVGPRPKTVDPKYYANKLIFSVKPGLTGPIQTKYHNSYHSWLKSVDKEIDYVKNVNFLTDLFLILRTVIIVCQLRKSY